MATPVAVLSILVEANTSAATSSIERFNKGMKRAEKQAVNSVDRIGRKTMVLGRTMSTAGAAMTRNVTLPIAAVGAVATKMSLDFNRSMSLISTQAGGSAKEVRKLKGEVLALAHNSKFGPNQLAEGLFHVESAGYRGAKAMKVLNESQKLATVGNSDMERTTYALVSALQTGIKGTKNMGEAAGLMNAIVGHGDMRMEEFTSSLSSGVLPAAKNVGISLRDVGAALDVMTARGQPAQMSATRLRMTFSLMSATTEKAQKALAQVGLGADTLANTMRQKGLVPAVELLAHHLEGISKTKANRVLSEAFGGGRTSAAIQTLVQNVGDMRKRWTEIGKSVGEYGKKVKEAEANPMVKLQRAWSSIQASLIVIGNALVPVLIPAFEQIAGAVKGIGKWFSALSPTTKKWVVDIGIAVAALGPLLTIGGRIATVFGGVTSVLGKVGAATGVLTSTTTASTTVGGAGAAGGGAAAGGWLGKLGLTEGAAGAVLPVTIAVVGSYIANKALEKTTSTNTRRLIENGPSGLAGGSPIANTKTLLGMGGGGNSGADLASYFDAQFRHITGNKTRLGLQKQSLAGLAGLMATARKGIKKGIEEGATKADLAPLEKHVKQAVSVKKARFSFAQNIEALSSGEVTSMGDIKKLAERGSVEAARAFGKGTPEWRKASAANMEAVISAIKAGEKAGLITASQGQRQIASLMRHIKIVSGTDPFKIGKGFADSWIKAGKVTSAGIQSALGELRQMPPAARAIARQTMLEQVRQAEKGGRLVKGSFSKLRSAVVTELHGTKEESLAQMVALVKGIGLGTSSLDTVVSSGLSVLGKNVNAALQGLGVGHKLSFSLVTLGKAAAGIGAAALGLGGGKQRGGPINIGEPSGDSVPAVLEKGEYVLNRNAVKAVGVANLDHLNFRHASRFQGGGGIGHAPHVEGPEPLRSGAQGGLDKAWSAAGRFMAKHRPKASHAMGRAGAGPHGLGTFDGLPVANWIIPELMYASQHGWHGRITSGYRPGFDPHAPSGSEHALTTYPGGAVDFGGMVDPAGAANRRAFEIATRGYHGLRLIKATGFRDDGHMSGTGHQKGGLIGRAMHLAKGGHVPSWVHGSSKLSADQLATLAHYVNAKSPGLMSQIAEAESGGNPRSMGGAGDKGLWQIIPSTASAFGINYGQLFDPLANARGMKKILDGQGLGAWSTYNSGAYRSHPKGHVLGALAGATGTAGATKAKVPSSVRFHEKVATIVKGGFDIFKGKVSTAKLSSFGSLPTTIQGCTKELAERHQELSEYQAAYRSHHKDAEIRLALQANIHLLRNRISALVRQRGRLLEKKKQARIVSRIAKRAGFQKLTEHIESAERAYDVAEQFASQTTDLEPAENASSYITGKEEPAFQNVLGAENTWRNSILGAEGSVTQTIGSMQAQIANIEALKTKHPRAFRKQRYRIAALNKAITEARTFWDQSKGTGSFEDALINVQGYGGGHEQLGGLPAQPEAGKFGGLIFDTQNTIRELGLKLKEAASGTDNAAALAATQQLLREANQRNLVWERQAPVFKHFPGVGNFAGAFAAGGTVMGKGVALVGEKGPELATFPSGTVITPNDRLGTPGSGSHVRVTIHDKRILVHVDDKLIRAAIHDETRRIAKSGGNPTAGRGGGLVVT